MPRAALLSIHARVGGTQPVAWEDPPWCSCGVRGSARSSSPRAIARSSRSGGSGGPAGPRGLSGRPPPRGLPGREADDVRRGGSRPRGPPERAPVRRPDGPLLIRWDGARQPTVWMVPPPDVDPPDARLELARRYLHVFGPATPARSPTWAGIRPPRPPRRSRPSADRLTAVRPRSATPGSSPPTSRPSVPEPAATALAGCCRAATRTSCSGAPTASCLSPIRTDGRALDPPRLAGRPPRRGRGRRGLAAGRGHRHDPDLARADDGGTCRRRRRGRNPAATRCRGPDPRQLGRLRTRGACGYRPRRRASGRRRELRQAALAVGEVPRRRWRGARCRARSGPCTPGCGGRFRGAAPGRAGSPAARGWPGAVVAVADHVRRRGRGRRR